LMFARLMSDILGNDFRTSKNVDGQQKVTGEAVVLEPVFVHIVVGFLVIVSVGSLALLVLSSSRRRTLHTDLSTIASVMALVADNQTLLSDFAELDCCTWEDLHKILGQRRFKLVNDGSGTRQV
jgi:hypothetical protein